MSFLDFDTRQNMQNQNETIWMHYREDVSVPLSKNYFYKKKKLSLLLIITATFTATEILNCVIVALVLFSKIIFSE